MARRGGAVQNEMTLMGGTRLDEVDERARALGIRPGQTIAAARARTSEISVRVVHEGEARSALERIAEVTLGFGVTTALSEFPPMVWLDISGCAHLHEQGEVSLARKLMARIRAMGHRCRMAIADGPRVAAAVARFARGHPEHLILVPSGRSRKALAPLPLAALPLDAETRRWLTRIGVRTIAHLQGLPRRSLTHRLGEGAPAVFALLDGDDRSPLASYVPPEILEESVELDHGVAASEALVFVAKMLADRVGARLEGRGQATTALELVLRLDQALLGGGAPRLTFSLPLPTPLWRPSDLLAVLRSRLERLESGGDGSDVLGAPVLSMTLSAPQVVSRRADPIDLFVPEAKASRSLPRLAAELEAEWGEACAGTLSLTNAWLPEKRTMLRPLRAHGERVSSPARLESTGEEPLRWGTPVRAPRSLTGAVVAQRIEASEWWRGEGDRRDYLVAWDEEEGAVAWVEMRAERATIRGWLD